MRTSEKINYWPALLDLVTATLMVFLMVTFLQTLLSIDELKALITRSRQEGFLELFRKEFSPELIEGEISIRRDLNFLQITFSDRVLFESGDYRLQPAGRDLLDRCASIFIHATDSHYEQIQVEGHTDNRSLHRTSYPSNNWQLSTARAISVVEFLAGRGDLEPKLSANGYASFRPVARNTSAVGRARNRRIEIRVFFSGTGLGSLDDIGKATAVGAPKV